jgi:diaminohydroxyphosphoribosylaminopyrimidine deaminase/5-amino-6-(5-phosphoribosylamino)uracil reductase
MDFTPETDARFMRRALELAEHGRGFVSPNPLVGCVIVDASGTIIGEGFHERFGQAHAEINALKAIKNKALLQGATVYVTLEPCAHHGKTPPCADELTRWPIKRVVAALQDPNPKVDGGGFVKLRAAGIAVAQGILESEAKTQNRFFLRHITTGKPFVTLKIAQTLDGYIATQGGQNDVITGKAAQTLVHRFRAQHDAVLIGRNTAQLDNPRLTVRLVEGRQPWRIVLDGDGSLPESLNLFNDQFSEKTIRVTWNRKKAEANDPMLALISGNSSPYHWLTVPQKEGHCDLENLLIQLGKKGIASVLVEGGQRLSTALLKADLADSLEVFIAPKVLGGGVKSVLGLGVTDINRALRLKNPVFEQIGEDLRYSAQL